MRDHESAMLTYVQLAAIAQQRRQPLGCVRFLVLAGGAACRAGWPEVAARCRELVLAHNQRHQLGRFADFPDAMRAEEFSLLLKQLERQCPYEMAEHLLLQAETDRFGDHSASEDSTGTRALQLLSPQAWEEASSKEA